MDARLDVKWEGSGGFQESTAERPIPGQLRFDPETGIELKLVENPRGNLHSFGEARIGNIFGKLVDGTKITLCDCYISNASLQTGIGIGSPTTIVSTRAIFNRHVENLGELKVKKYSMELSSLANWTCSAPIKLNYGPHGWDITYGPPASIKVSLPSQLFDLEISLRTNMQNNSVRGECTLTWSAAIGILCKTPLPFEKVSEIAWQCQNLMALLVGEPLCIREIEIMAPDPLKAPSPEISEVEIAKLAHALFVKDASKHGNHLYHWFRSKELLESRREENLEQPLRLMYQQIGRHDLKDLHPSMMILPYAELKDRFPEIVSHWLDRTPQSVLATNVYFFASKGVESPAVNVRFLNATQATESYHRSLGTGLYMDQASYEAAMQQFSTHLPSAIQGDHRQSLKNRLKYGNEHSLRKRLTAMFERLPSDLRLSIAGDVSKFIQKVVDTRNYYTHYDHASQSNAFEGSAAYVAAERLNILLVANVLIDLGIQPEKLMRILRRRREFAHWLSQNFSV